MTAINPEKAAKCIARIYEVLNQLESEGFSDFEISCAMTMLLQGRGVTPEAYEVTFQDGRAVYEDFEQYHAEAESPPGQPIIP